MLPILAILGLAAAWFVLFRTEPVVRGTTLKPVWGISLAALTIWTGAIGCRWAFDFDATPQHSSHLCYVVAIATLAAFVMVLGARRPIDKVWPWFVLLPLVLVLMLPSWTNRLWGPDSPLRLETPRVLGFAVVLVMGIGNYLFTRLSLPALLLGTAIVLLVYPSTDYGTGSSYATALDYAGICLGLAAVSGWLLMRSRPDDLQPQERIWADFRNSYGIVWAKRVMDRVNWTAAEEKWPLRLDLHGVVWTNAEATDAEREHAIERLRATFGWLLKRFVDEGWMERRGEGFTESAGTR